MPSERPRITMRIEPEEWEYLQQWAKEDFIEVPQLARVIVRKAIAAREASTSGKEALELALSVIKTMVEGKPPTLAQLVKLAHEANLKEEDLLKLRDYVMEKTTNGV